ncbi:MAG: hypothetical protein ABSA54_05070 [Terriglobales bacterium]
MNRHRGKVSQQVVVGNVNVNEGGRAEAGTGPFVAPHGIDNMIFTSFRYYLP